MASWGLFVRHPRPAKSCGPHHHYLSTETLNGCRRTSGRMGGPRPPPETSRKPVNIDSREMRSNAPMTSIEVTVASGLNPVSPCKACAMHSHPARMLKAFWFGAVAFSNGPPAQAVEKPEGNELDEECSGEQVPRKRIRIISKATDTAAQI